MTTIADEVFTIFSENIIVKSYKSRKMMTIIRIKVGKKLLSITCKKNNVKTLQMLFLFIVKAYEKL